MCDLAYLELDVEFDGGVDLELAGPAEAAEHEVALLLFHLEVSFHE